MKEVRIEFRPMLAQHTRNFDDNLPDAVDVVWEVYADGEPTGITRVRKVDSSTRRTTSDLLSSHGDQFDMVSTRGYGMRKWIIEHLEARQGDDS